jgi:hypothetical protein
VNSLTGASDCTKDFGGNSSKLLFLSILKPGKVMVPFFAGGKDMVPQTLIALGRSTEIWSFSWFLEVSLGRFGKDMVPSPARL